MKPDAIVDVSDEARARLLAFEAGFVIITVIGGKGRRWTPEPNDASWRDMAEPDLNDFHLSAHFVQRRGDPYGLFKVGTDIATSQWVYLAEALRIASTAWQPPDTAGTSYPTTKRAELVEAGRFLQHAGAVPMLATMTVIPNSSGVGLALSTPSLAGFLIGRAALALANPQPVRRCAECGFWFEVSRVRRQPRFCSSSCRATHHEKENYYGVRQEEHHPQRDHAVASGVARTGAGRKDQAADKELRKSKGSPRPRPAQGKGSRTRRHR